MLAYMTRIAQQQLEVLYMHSYFCYFNRHECKSAAQWQVAVAFMNDQTSRTLKTALVSLILPRPNNVYVLHEKLKTEYCKPDSEQVSLEVPSRFLHSSHRKALQDSINSNRKMG